MSIHLVFTGEPVVDPQAMKVRAEFEVRRGDAKRWDVLERGTAEVDLPAPVPGQMRKLVAGAIDQWAKNEVATVDAAMKLYEPALAELRAVRFPLEQEGFGDRLTALDPVEPKKDEIELARERLSMKGADPEPPAGIEVARR